jgi:hypothetical protein
MIHPEHTFRKRWDVAQVFALVYVAILVPVRTGFSLDLELFSAGWVIELVVDVYFIIDIFLNFRTGFLSDHELEMQPGRVACHYMKGWFTIDVVSCRERPTRTRCHCRSVSRWSSPAAAAAQCRSATSCRSWRRPAATTRPAAGATSKSSRSSACCGWPSCSGWQG